MRLWMRLALVMSALALLPVIAVGITSMEVATRRAEETSEARLSREATDQADMVGRWVHDQARFVLGQPEAFFDRLGAMSPEAQLGFARLVYRQVFSAVTVVLIDGDGRAVVDPVFLTEGDRVPSSMRRAQELIERLPLTAAQELPDLVHMGDAWLPDGLGTVPSIPMIVLAAPGLDSAEQRFLGVEISLEIAEDLTSGVTPTHAVALMDGFGNPLVGGGHPLLPTERLRALMGNDELIDFRLEGREGEVRGTLAPVPNTPRWSLVVVEPASAVLQPAVDIRGRMAPSLILAAAGALSLALVVAGSLSRPVEQLRNVALRLADGALDTRAGIVRKDEIGELGQAFDHLAGRLQANQREIETQQGEIEAFNLELQDRVAERTRELERAQDQLVRSGQLAAVAELSAGLAHELNNPLTGVLGIAQLLRSRNPDEALLRDLEDQAARCREVVGTMLRVSSVQVDPTQTPVVDLHDVLAQVTDLVGGAFRQRGVRLELGDLGSRGLRVRVEAAHCTRLLTQLLAGVRAGLNSGAAVTVGAEPVGGNVAVTVLSDRPLAEQLDRADDLMAAGHGLWVARQLVDRLGGSLEEGPDRRSWTMTLPGAKS